MVDKGMKGSGEVMRWDMGGGEGGSRGGCCGVPRDGGWRINVCVMGRDDGWDCIHFPPRWVGRLGTWGLLTIPWLFLSR